MVNFLTSVSPTRPRQPSCAESRAVNLSAILDGLGVSKCFFSLIFTCGAVFGGGVRASRSTGLETLFFHSSSPLFFKAFNLEVQAMYGKCLKLSNNNLFVCLFDLGKHFQQSFSLSQRCLDVAGSSMLTFRKLPN